MELALEVAKQKKLMRLRVQSDRHQPMTESSRHIEIVRRARKIDRMLKRKVEVGDNVELKEVGNKEVLETFIEAESLG